MESIFSYQWRGLHRQPYRVFWSNRYSSFAASRSPEGGKTIVTSSGGRTPWQKVFLQSPCLRPRQCWTARLMRKWRLSKQWTGANQLLLDQLRHSPLPKTTIWDLAQRGNSWLSFLIVKTHIVGIALGEPFSCKAQHLPRVRRLKVPRLLMPWSGTSHIACV